MRAFALIRGFAAFGIIIFGSALAGSAIAADGAPAGSTWADVETAAIGLLLLVIGIAATMIARVLPALITAWTAKLVEDATTARVDRIDKALDEAIATGVGPSNAAEIVADKLPDTLKRSRKDKRDLTREAIVKSEARSVMD